MMLAIGFVTPASMAGPKGYGCTLDTQTCLNKMAAKLKTTGWLGIEYENREGPDRMKIVKVVSGSPAEDAGFRVGDVLVSINGAEFADNDEDECATCKAMKGIWKPGANVEYVVRRGDQEVALSPTLASLPPDVMAMMLGMHIVEHARPEAPSK
jgi:predicted metalloprotease with PDZ domain